MDADGKNVRRLTYNGLRKERPNWSPDGSHIVFGAWADNNWDIHSVDITGADYRALTIDPARDYRPGWSPDSRQIVFESDREGGRNRIYIMDADGRNLRLLSHIPVNSFSPVWW